MESEEAQSSFCPADNHLFPLVPRSDSITAETFASPLTASSTLDSSSSAVFFFFLRESRE